MDIRPAVPADLDAMASGMRAVAEEGWLSTRPSISEGEIRAQFESAIGDPEHAVFVLVDDDGEVIGSAGLHPAGAEGVKALGLWIAEGLRGKGGGRALLDVAVSHAEACGAHKVELEVFPDNSRAIALYASVGFEVQGLRRDHYLRDDGSLRSALMMATYFPRP